MSSKRSSIMASPSKRRTQRKHVTINQDKNEVVEFQKVPRTENENLWTTDREFYDAIKNSKMVDIVSQERPSRNEMENSKRWMDKANKEVNARKTVPMLAASVARGTHNKRGTKRRYLFHRLFGLRKKGGKTRKNRKR
jgi:hypothetical protein